jgi:iron complex outermembrane receptor protein
MKKTPQLHLFGLALLGASFPLTAQTVRPPAAVEADEIVELSPFVITTTSDEEGRVTESTSGTLVSRPLEKLPMGIAVVSAELMKQLNILNADSLNLVVPGLANQNNTTSEGTGNNTQYASRGFTTLPRRNGFAPGGRLYDMTGIDRVEVIRGPNSLLYGQNEAGGIINYITKRPRLRNALGVRGVATAAYGNYDFVRAQTDLDMTVLPGKFGVRLPASWTTNKREFNFFENNVLAVNPSVLWRPFSNTEITYEWEYLDVRTHFGAFQPIVWRPPGVTTDFVDKNNRGLGRAARGGLFGPFARAENEQTNWTLDLTSKLTDNLTFRGVYTENRRDRNETVPTGGDPFRAVPVGYYGANTIDGNRIEGYKLDLLGQWDLGPFKTRTVLGFEYNRNLYFASIYRGWRNGARDILYTLNLGYDPVTQTITRPPRAQDFAPFNGISGSYRDTKLDPNYWRLESGNPALTGPSQFLSRWSNTRLSEVLSAYDDRLQILAGVAQGKSKLQNLTTTAVTGTSSNTKKTVYQTGVGVVFDKRKKHMAFLNRSLSYNPQFLFDINNEPLPPNYADGWEGGLKSTWDDAGKLSTTVVLYTQKRQNIGRQYTDFALNPPRTYGILTPGEKSRGVEFEAWYKPTKQLSFTLLYAQFDGQITGAAPGREFVIGLELPRAPEKMGNLLMNYRFGGGTPLNGLNLTLGANYRNDTWLDTGLSNLQTLTRRSDSGTTYFAALAREFKLSGRRALAVRLNLGNLLNRDYITEGSTFGEKFTWRLGTDFKF